MRRYRHWHGHSRRGGRRRWRLRLFWRGGGLPLRPGRKLLRAQFGIERGNRAKRQQAQGQHFERRARVGGLRHAVATVAEQGVEQLHVLGAHLRRELLHDLRVAELGIGGAGNDLLHRNSVQQAATLVHRRGKIHALLGHVRALREHLARILGHQGLQQADKLAPIHGTEHGHHIGLAQFSAAAGDGLLGQRQGVAHAARRRAAQRPQGGLVAVDALFAQHLLQVRHHALGGHVFEVELQTSRQHGRGQLLRVRGGEQEFDVFGRLFEGF